MMWNETVNPNWIWASSSAASPNVPLLQQFGLRAWFLTNQRRPRPKFDGRLGPRVDRELEHVGAGVVPHHVKIVLAAGDQPPVNLGELDRFAAEVRFDEY